MCHSQSLYHTIGHNLTFLYLIWGLKEVLIGFQGLGVNFEDKLVSFVFLGVKPLSP
jgi:hypothetical protein